MLVTIVRGRSFDGNTKNRKNCYIDQHRALVIEIIIYKSIDYCLLIVIGIIFNKQCLKHVYVGNTFIYSYSVEPSKIIRLV